MRALRTAATCLVATALLAGCGLFGGDEPDDPTPTGGGGSTSQAPEGPTPEELSQQVLDAAAEQQELPAVATATGTSEAGRAVTVEVVSLQRVQDATLVTMRWTGDGDSALGPVEFGTQKYSGQSFARSLYLVDATVTKTRYLPLQFDDYREACACPALPVQVGADPSTVTALFPPLPPEVTAVDLEVGDPAWLTVPAVPVEG